MSRPLRQRPARKRQQHPERFGALPRRSGDLGHLQRSACVPMQTLLCRHEYSLVYVRLLADRYHRSCALAPNNRHHPEHVGALSRRPGYLVHLPGSACVEKVYCDLLVDRSLRSLGLAPSVRFLGLDGAEEYRQPGRILLLSLDRAQHRLLPPLLRALQLAAAATSQHTRGWVFPRAAQADHVSPRDRKRADGGRCARTVASPASTSGDLASARGGQPVTRPTGPRPLRRHVCPRRRHLCRR